MAIELIGDLEAGVKREIQNRITKMAEAEIDRAKQEIERRVREEMGNIVLSLLRFYDIRHMGDSIVITVRNDLSPKAGAKDA